MKKYTSEKINEIANILHAYDEVLNTLREIEKEGSIHGVANIPSSRAEELIRYGKNALNSYRYYVPKEVDEKLKKENMGLPTQAGRLEGVVRLQENVLAGKPIRI